MRVASLGAREPRRSFTSFCSVLILAQLAPWTTASWKGEFAPPSLVRHLLVQHRRALPSISIIVERESARVAGAPHPHFTFTPRSTCRE
jgi:hypothetical protein